MIWLADNSDLVHAVAVISGILGLGLGAAWLLAKFTQWYDDRPERRRMRELIEETEEQNP